jgi:ribosomal protein S18 acetylase RimI-like enzyme
MPERHRYAPPEAKEKFQPKPVELQTKEELTQFWLNFKKNNPFSPTSPKTETRMAQKQADAMISQIEKEGENRTTFYYGVKDESSLIGTGKLEIKQYQDGKHAYLSMLTVDDKYRGKGVAKELTDVRTEKAKQEGCTHIDTDVFSENAVALVTKLNDGYILNDIKFYDEKKSAGSLKLSKPIDDRAEYDKKTGELGDLQEIPLSDLIAIENLLKQGWAGIDAKNLDDEKNKDPKKWLLIMEKKSGPKE